MLQANGFLRLGIGWILLALAAASAGAGSGRYYVKQDATGANDGSSWENAYTELRFSLDHYSSRTIWIARGTYKPSDSDPNAYFQALLSVDLIGGFAGNETSLEQRDVAANPTILSGDLLGNDGPDFSGMEDNSRIVLWTHPATHRDLIIMGSVEKAVDSHIANKDIIAPSATFVNCRFINHRGKGLYANDIPHVDGCTFQHIGSTALVCTRADPAYYGDVLPLRAWQCKFQACGLLESVPALYVALAGKADVSQCLFVDNPAGAAESYACSPPALYRLALTDCILWRNGPAPLSGDGAFNISNCLVEHALSVPAPLRQLSNVFDADPRFVDSLGPDGVPGTFDEDFHLAADSPCIDRGSVVTGQDSLPGCRRDIGLFESPYFRDCDGDGQPDACEILQEQSLDQNHDGRMDQCAPFSSDCNGNGILDFCEPDADGDGVPDECEPLRLAPCPGDVTAHALSDSGAYVDFGVPAAFGGIGAVQVSSSAQPGDLLPIGETTVTVHATDSVGNVAECSFLVSVLPPESAPNSDGDGPGLGIGLGGCAPFAMGLTVVAAAGMALSRRRRRRGTSTRGLVLVLAAGTLGLWHRTAQATDCNENGISDEQESPIAGGLIYVNATATGTNTGASWEDAYTSLHAGLCAAQRLVPSNSPVTVFIAAGVYRPAGAADGFDRGRSFVASRPLKLSGSWRRQSDGSWAQEPGNPTTTLDGDLLGDDGPNFANSDDNSLHVLRLNTTSAAPSELEAITIRGGNADGANENGRGAAILANTGTLSLTRCHLLLNQAADAGGAIYSDRLVFLTGCRLFANESPVGSAIVSDDIEFESCVVDYNGRGHGAAALAIHPETRGYRLWFARSTAFGNAGFLSDIPADSTLLFASSSILWNNGPAPYPSERLQAFICDLEIAVGNGHDSILADPQFLDTNGPDQVAGTLDDRYDLSAQSPCIDAGMDAGDSLFDYAGNPRSRHCHPDIGAVESDYFRDCDANGFGDHCEFLNDPRRDSNNNRILDACEPLGCAFIDRDGNGIADQFDFDADDDGVPDVLDACPFDYLRTRSCDGPPDYVDNDGDGVPDNFDNCPTIPNHEQADFNDDGIGDACAPLVFASCPADVTVAAQASAGATLAIAWPATIGGVGPVTVTSDAPADGRFSIGSRTVTFSAIDAAGTTVHCSLQATVMP